MMKEHAGVPYPLDAAEAIKQRVAAHRLLVDALGNVDMTDPEGAAVLVLPQSAMFICDQTMIPQLVYGVATTLSKLMDQAQESGDPELMLSSVSAVTSVFGMGGFLKRKEEVTDDENGND